MIFTACSWFNVDNLPTYYVVNLKCLSRLLSGPMVAVSSWVMVLLMLRLVDGLRTQDDWQGRHVVFGGRSGEIIQDVGLA